MALAETAHLVTQLDLKDNLGPGMAKARAEVASADAATVKATKSVSGLSRVSRGAAGSMTHFKNKAGELTKVIGGAGLLGGVAALVVGIKHGVDAAAQWGVTTDRLHQLTGASINDASRFADAYDKLGISQDKQIRIMGFLSKTLGNFNTNAKAAKKVQTDFGFSLRDSHGHMKNALQVTQDFTAYFNNKHIPSYMKAALGAKLFGRGWTDMIPVFQKGKRAMDEAMGGAMHLDKTQVAQLHAWRDAQQELNDSVGDLSVQIGLAAIPALTELSRGITKFVDEHQADIRDLFAKGLQMAKAFAGFIANDVAPNLMKLGSAAVGFWNAIPGPLRDMIATGFVADRAIKFMFGFSPVGLAASLGKDVIAGLIKGTLGQFLERGSPANPMFVVSEGGLGGGVPGGGAAGGGGLLGKLGGIKGMAAIAGGAAAYANAGADPKGLGGQMEKAAGALGVVGGAFMVGGPVAAALAGIVVAVQTVADEIGTIGNYQKQNAGEAAGILNDPTSKTRLDLTHMVSLLREQGATRVVVDTTSAREIQTALINAGSNILNRSKGDSRIDILSGIAKLQDAQIQATEHGWTGTADQLGRDIQALRKVAATAPEHAAKVTAKAVKQSGFDLLDPLKGVRDMARAIMRQGRLEHREKIRTERTLAHLAQVHTHEGAKAFVGAINQAQRLIRQGTKDGLVTNSHKVKGAIDLMRTVQKRALEAGHAKLARNLGRDIERMKAALNAKAQIANAKLNVIANKDTSVKVTTNVTSTIGVRSLESSQSVVQRYGRVQAF